MPTPKKEAKDKLKSGPKRTEAQRLQDRETLSRGYLQGKTLLTLSKEVNLSTGMVSFILKEIQQEWIDNAVFNVDKLRLQQLAKIDEVERVAWESYLISLERTDSVSQLRRGGKTSRVVSTSTKSDKSSGDPRFLTIILSCVNKRCEMMGLNAPKLDLDITNLDYSRLNDDQLAKIATGDVQTVLKQIQTLQNSTRTPLVPVNTTDTGFQPSSTPSPDNGQH